jgi:ADP-ribosylglycohydrolase
MNLGLDERITGSLLAMAIGDALGAEVFRIDRQAISTMHPGGLRQFVKPPADNYFHALQAGEVTDGTSQALLLAATLASGGTTQLASRYFDALRAWREQSAFARYVGPTTAQALQNEPPKATDNARGSNGAAMRTAPIGWFTAGNPTFAAELAAESAGTTHTGASVIGAAMIAAAVSTATAGAPLRNVLSASRKAIDQTGRLIGAPQSQEAMTRAFDDAIEHGRRAASARPARGVGTDAATRSCRVQPSDRYSGNSLGCCRFRLRRRGGAQRFRSCCARGQRR